MRLDALRDDDAPALFMYRSHPDVARYQGWQPTQLDEARRWIAGQNPTDTPAPGQWFQRAIRRLESGALIGDLGACMPAEPGMWVDIGITLAPSAQGRGFASEALAGFLAWLFAGQLVRRVTASVDPRNQACMRLMGRLGFRQEAHFVQSIPWQGGWADDVVWAMLAHEWAALRGDTVEDRGGTTR
uniref:GNAT family N-acetyltransferase n=1 Tax=Dyella soli TaxID=522319 RepID=UPI001F106C41|nr:GNAT family protein [Dyella soli]